jgi:hypothetical protein
MLERGGKKAVLMNVGKQLTATNADHTQIGLTIYREKKRFMCFRSNTNVPPATNQIAFATRFWTIGSEG